ncbi:hypothetical protein VaNZ11_008613 [Volvox africanus]|uniref:Mediator of RNA polymerase II transcription subunit 20 n=1 Tax=Volvox africanus TaxID=51714 RepID=A0ABQ5S5Q3_9CHLO|nr:hypothetical protein VaNZ11_008613 [Volvox africanus]
MGVKILIRSLPPKGVAGPAQHDLLKRLVDELCASQLAGRLEAWSVTCQLMKQGHGLVGAVGGPAANATSGGLKDMWAVSFRDAPEMVFLLQRPEHKVLECEAAMMRLLEKKLEYAKQMTVRFEGHTYSKGDFLIRLCTATQAIHSTQTLLGHCMELEYLPVSNMASSEGMLSEFVDLLRQVLAVVDGRQGSGSGGSGGTGSASLQLEIVKPPYDKYGLVNIPYGRAHSAVAYTDLVMMMLSSSTAAAQQQQQQQAQQQQQQLPPSTQQQIAK